MVYVISLQQNLYYFSPVVLAMCIYSLKTDTKLSKYVALKNVAQCFLPILIAKNNMQIENQNPVNYKFILFI